MIHFMRLKKQPFESIKKGIKTIELRLYDEKRKEIRVGDEICFQSLDNAEALRVKVVNLHLFASFEELYKSLPLDKCGYTDADIVNAHYTDMEAFYSREEQAQYGVVGIELLLL